MSPRPASSTASTNSVGTPPAVSDECGEGIDAGGANSDPVPAIQVTAQPHHATGRRVLLLARAYNAQSHQASGSNATTNGVSRPTRSSDMNLSGRTPSANSVTSDEAVGVTCWRSPRPVRNHGGLRDDRSVSGTSGYAPGAYVHGVCCTVHPERGPDPVHVMYVLEDDGFVGHSYRPRETAWVQGVVANAA